MLIKESTHPFTLAFLLTPFSFLPHTLTPSKDHHPLHLWQSVSSVAGSNPDHPNAEGPWPNSPPFLNLVFPSCRFFDHHPSSGKAPHQKDDFWWQANLGRSLVVEKIKRLPCSKSLEVAFTGMILCSLDGGHPGDCISIFEEMKHHCTPNIGTINATLKVYSCSDMFERARELFESIKDAYHDGTLLTPDSFSYTSMLDASAAAQQWEYFEYVYKETTLRSFQIVQSKHARLLLAASRAGKEKFLVYHFSLKLYARPFLNKILREQLLSSTAWLMLQCKSVKANGRTSSKGTRIYLVKRNFKTYWTTLKAVVTLLWRTLPQLS